MIIDAHADYTTAPPELQAYRGRQILPGGGPKTTRIAETLDGKRFLKLFKDTMALYGRGK